MGKSVSAFRSRFYCLFVACSAGQTLEVIHFTESAKNQVND